MQPELLRFKLCLNSLEITREIEYLSNSFRVLNGSKLLTKQFESGKRESGDQIFVEGKIFGMKLNDHDCFM